MQGIVGPLCDKNERLFLPAVHFIWQAKKKKNILEELVGDICPIQADDLPTLCELFTASAKKGFFSIGSLQWT